MLSLKTLPLFEFSHLEPMRGTFVQNEKYASKQSNLVHFGDPPIGKGGRTDRNEVFKLLKDGATDEDLMEADFGGYNRFRNSIADYRSLKRPQVPAGFRKENYIFFGLPGSGKTQLAQSQFPDDYFRTPLGKEMWFTRRAQGKRHLIIDDFKSNIQLADLLQLLDSEPVEVPCKGGFVWAHFESIIITTNRSPHDWYNYSARDYEKQALFRRFSHGGCYRFYKNVDRVPRPVEIDLFNPRHFSENYHPGQLYPVFNHIVGHVDDYDGLLV